MIGLKNSYEIAYNGTENECRFELYADTAADLQGLTHFDGIKIQMGSECTDIATGDKYILNGSGAWILQPKDNAFTNVYTKAEIDNMSNVIYQTMLYYHTAQESSDGSITFYTLGTPVGSLTIYGNGQQTGTPTPDNPVMPTFCGVRTANVMPAGENKIVSNNGITFESDGNGRYHIHGTATEYASARFYLVSGFTTPISISKGGQGTLSLFNSQATSAATFGFYNGRTKVDDWSMTSQDRTSTAYNTLGNKYVDSVIITVASGSTVDITITPELTNDGVLPSRFEPYGYKIPLTCAGQTNNVYLSAPLRKAIDGSDAVDTLDSAGTLTRNVDENGDALVTPTTETIDVPAIPTVKGENTLTVDTELPPSLIEISGGITHE